MLRCVTFMAWKRNIHGSPHVVVSSTIWTPDFRLYMHRSDPASCFKGTYFRKQSALMWNFKNKCCVYRVENAAQATRLPLLLGVKHVQAPLGGPSACLTGFNEATRPTARRARNNHAWHHYSQLKYLQRCVERVGNFKQVEGDVSPSGDPKNYVNKQKTFDKTETLNIRFFLS